MLLVLTLAVAAAGAVAETVVEPWILAILRLCFSTASLSAAPFMSMALLPPPLDVSPGSAGRLLRTRIVPCSVANALGAVAAVIAGPAAAVKVVEVALGFLDNNLEREETCF
jgi:hypothetical protein